MVQTILNMVGNYLQLSSDIVACLICILYRVYLFIIMILTLAVVV